MPPAVLGSPARQHPHGQPENGEGEHDAEQAQGDICGRGDVAEHVDRHRCEQRQQGGTGEGASPLLAGTGKDQVHLFVVATSDRGLAGAFNTNIARLARKRAGQGKKRSQCRHDISAGISSF